MDIKKGEIVIVKGGRCYVAINDSAGETVECRKIDERSMRRESERVNLCETVFHVNIDTVVGVETAINAISRKIGLLPQLSDDELKVIDEEIKNTEEVKD